MIPILIQLKYCIYFIIFGIFIGAYFDLSKSIVMLIQNSKFHFFKNNITSNIFVALLEVVILSFLIYISLEYTFKVSNGYAPLHISIFFLSGYFIYQCLLKKDCSKNLFILGYYLKKYHVKEKINNFFKNVFINNEVLEKSKKTIKNLLKHRKKDKNCDIILPEK